MNKGRITDPFFKVDGYLEVIMEYKKADLNGKTHQQLVEIVLELQEKLKVSKDEGKQELLDFLES